MSSQTTVNLSQLFQDLANGTPMTITSSAGYTILPSPPVLSVTDQIIAINNSTTLSPEQKAYQIAQLAGIPYSVNNDPNNAQITIYDPVTGKPVLITNTGVNSSSPVPTDPSYFGGSNFNDPLFGGPTLAGVDPYKTTTVQPAGAPNQITTPPSQQTQSGTDLVSQIQQWMASFGQNTQQPTTQNIIPSIGVPQVAPSDNQIVTPSVSQGAGTQQPSGILSFFSQNPIIIALGFAALAFAISFSKPKQVVLI